MDIAKLVLLLTFWSSLAHGTHSKQLDNAKYDDSKDDGERDDSEGYNDENTNRQ